MMPQKRPTTCTASTSINELTHMNTHRRTSRSGFTVPELIVVLSVAIMLLGSLAPALSALRSSTQMQVAINTVSIAVTAARAYATAGTEDDLGDLAEQYPNEYAEFTGFEYSGTAMLFTPAGELRLVQNVQLARNGSNNYLQPLRNGYADVSERDYIKLPRDVGIVGIARNRSSITGLLLLTPPFAIRFDPHGGLVAAQPASLNRTVYYDRDYNGTYTTSVGRTASYSPDAWDPNSPAYNPAHWNNTENLHELPFDEIETVVGVVIYSKRELRGSGRNHSASVALGNPINESARDWIRENGTILFFSRYSGAVIKQPKP